LDLGTTHDQNQIQGQEGCAFADFDYSFLVRRAPACAAFNPKSQVQSNYNSPAPLILVPSIFDPASPGKRRFESKIQNPKSQFAGYGSSVDFALCEW
jgi:hypothetical protein